MIEAHYHDIAGKLRRSCEAVKDPALAARTDPAFVVGAVKDDAAHP